VGYGQAMRPVEFYIILTADGMYADPDGGLDHYDPAEDEHRYANGLTRAAGDIVMGRRMYEVMEYWDSLDLEDPDVPDVEREYAELWRATPKHVVSRGQPALRANADLIEGDVVDAVRRLKDGDGAPIELGGGAELLATLATAGLIDTYRFLVIPSVLGKGKAMFAAIDDPLRLRLTGTRTFSAGSVLLEYEPAG
jgi:dihydrofolate reductase